MDVKLIAHTTMPESVVAAAARLCYSADDPQDLLAGMDSAKTGALVDKLASMGHLSPFEHANFTFAISGISRATSHQLVRHRIASYSQRSQRYVRETDFDYVVPPRIAQSPEGQAKFVRLMDEIARAYAELATVVPPEDARYVLPNACTTAIVCSMNTRSLHNFFAHRLCRRAQWEIRELAEKMLAQVKEVAPALFTGAGAPCETSGTCPEGAMTCGYLEAKRMKERAPK
ncbi:FAD-dependent thymidylate synthase [Heliophilum fasciatum]|uniref:Flavin-dependent thymidylate synthase n=1 Tax=Heliophilum fasciatum TaxID=35700 RepID=A0A4R2RL77_9FIRM|nr:FAD-dependent thymidylate synthase [Heliophilum fasciatum]MCW2277835.1 thymidylate synthase (FAD) [Heliophilum fasciatum]TCP64672.1 thymidylate synthase (FAD) [Heliophilum fasciatum]